MSERGDKRTGICLDLVVWQIAEDMMRRRGFNKNFSAYVADLIRRDQERAELAKPRPVPVVYPVRPATKPELNETR